jgi:shikimate dehydrogenase
MINEVKFGLLGKNISYSFSKNYFSKKFDQLQLHNYTYKNFDIQSIDDLPLILDKNVKNLKGLNVTIPYKEDVFKYLDEIDKNAKEIGAVNTIKVLDDGRLKGFNTDSFGFEHSLRPLLNGEIKYALILGTGGASKAVAFVLKKLRINCKFVSRNINNKKSFSYGDLNEAIMNKYQLIINCTPLGTFPNIKKKPDLPYKYLTKEHLLYDLIYNPKVTAFLQEGIKCGSITKNGEEMLKLQADRSWEIWNS